MYYRYAIYGKPNISHCGEASTYADASCMISSQLRCYCPEAFAYAVLQEYTSKQSYLELDNPLIDNMIYMNEYRQIVIQRREAEGLRRFLWEPPSNQSDWKKEGF